MQLQISGNKKTFQYQKKENKDINPFHLIFSYTYNTQQAEVKNAPQKPITTISS